MASLTRRFVSAKRRLGCLFWLHLNTTLGSRKKWLRQVSRLASYCHSPAVGRILLSYNYISCLLCFSWFGKTPNRSVLPMLYVKTRGLSYPSNTIPAATWLVTSRKTSFLRLGLSWDRNGLGSLLNLPGARYWLPLSPARLIWQSRTWRGQREWLL